MKRTMLSGLITGLLCTGAAFANPVNVSYTELTPCDQQAGEFREELGLPPAPPAGPSGPFPTDEAISAVINQPAITGECSANLTNTANPDYRIAIRNLTTDSFFDLFFVADRGHAYNNYDGAINGGLAARIDNVGLNTPLVAEIGGTPDLVFEPGEVWIFDIIDWTTGTTPILPPHLFASFGVGTDSAGSADSTASIVANRQNIVPIPASAWLLASGLAGFGVLRRKRAVTRA